MHFCLPASVGLMTWQLDWALFELEYGLVRESPLESHLSQMTVLKAAVSKGSFEFSFGFLKFSNLQFLFWLNERTATIAFRWA